MNAYVFALKNILDKINKIRLDPAMLSFYLKTYILSRVQNIEPDIYIVSYPKCGRTWLRLMIQGYIELLYGESLFFLDKSLLGIPNDKIIKFEHDKGSWVPSPPTLKNLKFNELKYRNKRVVFLVRDPRDVLVSSWYHLKYRENIYSEPISAFIKDDLVGIEKIIGFMNLWIDNQDVPEKFCLVTYEQLHQDTFLTFRRILDFLSLPIKHAEIEKAIKSSSFQKMKSMEEKGALHEPWMKPGRKNFEESMKIRKGIIGGYKEVLSKEEIELINKIIADKLSPEFSYK